MVRSVLVNSDTPNYYSQIFYLIISHTEVVIITLLFLYKEKQYFIKTVIYSYIETNIKKRKIYSISTTKSVGEEIYIYILIHVGRDTCFKLRFSLIFQSPIIIFAHCHEL